MKRGKDEEKVLEPMFPRLHVNDADKGGPRAPPRNKMALYEQLSIPSQRFGDHASLSHNSRSSTTTLVHPLGSQSCGVERNLSSRHLDSSAPNEATENCVSQMSFMENVRSLAQHDQRKMVREEEEFAVPVFINSRRSQGPGRTKSGIEKEKHTPLLAPSSRHSTQFQEENRPGSKQNICLATFSNLEGREQVKANAKSGGFVISLDLSVTEGKNLEKSASSYDRVNDCDASLRQESRNRLYRNGGDIGVKDTDNGAESHLATESHLEEGHGSPEDIDTGREYSRNRGCASLQQINEDASDDVSDDSMVDSISSVDVSPDDVVGVLGQKRFWRARKAIANQQRVFAVQLFELHRLIKVQKLIAASPDILLDEINFLGKVSAKSYPVKKLVASEFMVKPPLPHVVVKQRGDSEKTDQHKMESSAENVVGRLSNQGHHHQQSTYMPFPNNPPASPAANGYCFPPQPPPSGNQQWLIPVMSPSEGLIYKPHPGMGHPGGYYGHFMPQPMVMPQYHPGIGFPPHPSNGYFPPYGIMPTMMNPYCSGQQQQPNEQHMNQFGYPGNFQQQPNEHMNQFVHPGNLRNTQQQSSVNEAAAQEQQQPTKSYPRARKSRQGSTGSSPSGREGIAVNKSFRPFSAVDDSNNINNEPEDMTTTTTTTTRTTVTQTTRDGGVTRVIKVVPHNAKLASENAARIFRSIQEERKRYDPSSNS
ncbi:PREDICTED: protein EARLY FLOWERING 3 [Camelina sativa]|uniref:Protein EARLY FLOWERING 3 n=1 Tax=Camelina sativa TaxID=90675 RepID=A0ABM0TQ66_CAMSA|nr:PREDICTED: protein EARLY FLOWERING 3 [Camelina sativa]